VGASLALALAAVIGLLWGVAGRADVVRPPPQSCPEGSAGVSSHAGPYCAPQTCTPQVACPKGQACETRKLCIAPKTIGGRRGPAVKVQQVLGSCEDGKKCAGGTCMSLRVCVPKAK
jgi:hypothetical protein